MSILLPVLKISRGYHLINYKVFKANFFRLIFVDSRKDIVLNIPL